MVMRGEGEKERRGGPGGERGRADGDTKSGFLLERKYKFPLSSLDLNMAKISIFSMKVDTSPSTK